MTREQNLRLAKVVQKIAQAVNEATDLAQELVMDEPKTGLDITTPTFEIGKANVKLLEVVKEHYALVNVNDIDPGHYVSPGAK